MTTIGGLTMNSYALPYRLGVNTSQSAQAAGPDLPASTGAGLASGEAATFKLSAALFELSFSDDGPRSGSMHGGAAPAASVAEQEFLSLANMDLAQLIRAKYLEDKNLTEEGLAALPEVEQKAIEEEIRNAILRSLGVEDTGEARGKQEPGPSPESSPEADQRAGVTSIVT